MSESRYDFNASGDYDKIVLLTDSNVRRMLPDAIRDYPVIEIAPGEGSKTIHGLIRVWTAMSQAGMTRRSLLVNVGGGVVSDLGGFAAATFKRGIRHINIPTTLLSMADAAIGGKTGIDFLGAKNEIGAFRMPVDIIIDSTWLGTLPRKEILEGMAEVVKSLLLDPDPAARRLYSDLLESPGLPELPEIGKMAESAARFKIGVVEKDPYDMGIRKILNFGHTAGHAFESLALEAGKPVGHGEAVAWGMLFALMVSERKVGLSSGFADGYRDKFLSVHYRPIPQEATAPEKVCTLMGRDKKNGRIGEVSMVLLKEPGVPVIDVSVGRETIVDTLDKMFPMRR